MSLLQEIEQHGLADCEYNRKLLGDQTMQQIAIYPNAEYGIESRIYQTDTGFNVALFDTDAEQLVCLFIRFQTLAQAVVKAKHLANIN